MQRHRLRISLKKLRYAIDFLGSLFREAEVDRYLRRVKRLQDELGDANDVRVAKQLLTKLETARHSPERSRAAGFVLGWHSERIAARERALQKQFRKFRHLDRFW
jgi:CHAD domain-containing protein